MIYQFRSKAGPDVIMLSDLTERIFAILGRPLEARGIFTVEHLPGLITALETAILKDLDERKEGESSQKGDRLGQRAYPFLELLKQSSAKEEPVMWGV
jgi:hypothetical protein